MRLKVHVDMMSKYMSDNHRNGIKTDKWDGDSIAPLLF